MKSGFVAVVGRPNVGKSTLVNALVGVKVAITSPRPQTTRNVIRGVMNHADGQMVFVDTPGLHRPKTALGERLNRLVYGSLADADAVLFVVDATMPIGPGDRLIAERLTQAGSPVVVAVNKVDIASEADLLPQLDQAAQWDFGAYVPVSALAGENLRPLVDELMRRLPEGPAFFPEGMTSDVPERVWFGELIREKFLARLRDELPHSLIVMVEDIEYEEGLTRINARALVERNSQKGIVIGKGGAMLRAVGSEARIEIERILGTKVFLELRVRVEPDWQQRPGVMDRLGL